MYQALNYSVDTPHEQLTKITIHTITNNYASTLVVSRRVSNCQLASSSPFSLLTLHQFQSSPINVSLAPHKRTHSTDDHNYPKI